MSLLAEQRKNLEKRLKAEQEAKDAAKRLRAKDARDRALATAITIARRKILGTAIDTVELTSDEKLMIGQILLRLPVEKRTADWEVVVDFLPAKPDALDFVPVRPSVPEPDKLEAAE